MCSAAFRATARIGRPVHRGRRALKTLGLHPVRVMLHPEVGVTVTFLRNPGESLLTLPLLLIVFFMVEGIAKIIFSLIIRPFPNWGRVLLSGVIGIVLALSLWGSMPITAAWLLGVMLGVGLISEGVGLAGRKSYWIGV